jgi:hypothetical protein
MKKIDKIKTLRLILNLSINQHKVYIHKKPRSKPLLQQLGNPLKEKICSLKTVLVLLKVETLKA